VIGDRRPVPWAATQDLDLLGVDTAALVFDADSGRFVSDRATFRPAAVLGTPEADGVRFDDWAAELPPTLGRELVLLMQAGAHAYGLWEDDELVLHRAEKRYVIRGNGKAQPTWLETRGKSRYGSRLRLQNAKAIVDHTIADLVGWTEERGAFDAVFFSCPVRAWADFRAHRPPPPFGAARLARIPLDVDVPTHAELLRVRQWLVEGSLVIVED
jgi:hypothetical protein